jgi:hypothetical protein
MDFFISILHYYNNGTLILSSVRKGSTSKTTIQTIPVIINVDNRTKKIHYIEGFVVVMDTCIQI